MSTRQQILAILHTIPDPEMPISIVDLGLLHDICITPANSSSHHTGMSSQPNAGSTHVSISLLPTFVGCPALDMIASDVRAKLSVLPGIASVSVNWLHDPPWSVDRISHAGRSALRSHGVTVPDHDSRLHPSTSQPVTLSTSAIPCPWCGSRSTMLESPFGPTRCRTIHYCRACKNSFEHMKHASS